MNELALFAGTGGGILGGKLCGFRTVAAVEIEPYRREILLRRQRDGVLPLFPIWDDVTTFDGRPYRGVVDIITGGFPCQDISCAGKGAGIDGERSGLWREYARIIGEVRPSYVFVENSPALTGRGLNRVLGDLSSMGYDAEWGVISAEDAIFLDGPPALYHLRERIWIIAAGRDAHETLPSPQREIPSGASTEPAGVDCSSDPEEIGPQGCRESIKGDTEESRGRDCQSAGIRATYAGANAIGERSQRVVEARATPGTTDRPGNERDTGWWGTEPELGRVADGISHRVDRIAAVGDAQVPAVVALAWRLLGPQDNNETGA